VSDGEEPGDPAPEPAEPAGDPEVEPEPAAATESTDAERAAMECVTGARVAEEPVMQAFFDEAGASAAGMELSVEGSLVYEFLEHGFGLNVIPTEFAMVMDTSVGTVRGEVGGTMSGLWTVRGDEIHAAGEAWQSSITMRWTFDGADMDMDFGEQSMLDGFTDVDRFECDGDTLLLQSKGGPALPLARMTDR